MANSGLGTAAGPDITLSRCLGSCWDLEARYFQIDGWRNAKVFSATSPGPRNRIGVWDERSRPSRRPWTTRPGCITSR